MADRPALEAIVFDAGGTLARLDFEWMAAALGELGHPVEPAALRRAEIEGRRAYDASVRGPGGSRPLGGPGDVRVYFGGMVSATGAADGVIAAAVARFLERERTAGLWVRPMEGARAALDGVAALGLRRAVVSNSDGRAEWHLEHTGLRDGVEFVVDSTRVGFEKPDPRIFRIALERLGVPPERALYVGDLLAVDRAGARAAGMHFVLIDPLGDYAGADTAGIPSIAELPAWVAGTFAVPAPLGRIESTRQGG